VNLWQKIQLALAQAVEKDPESEIFLARHNRVTPLTAGGSDRVFVRLRGRGAREFGADSVVLLIDSKGDRLGEYLRALAILTKVGLYPPEFIAGSARIGLVVLEDVGADSLYRLERAGKGTRTTVYDAAIEALRVLASVPGDRFRSDPVLGCRRFDVNALREETKYFAREVLGRRLGWSPERAAKLDTEFDLLAAEVSRGPYALMHRDYQSQNLHWRAAVRASGRRHLPAAPRKNALGRLAILDFQNLTWGPALYDLASLVRDPYVSLRPPRQLRLVRIFLEGLPESHSLEAMNAERFERLYFSTALQRHLQACAAYVFLSRVRRKKAFAPYLAPGLALALEDARRLKDFPGVENALEVALASPAPPRLE
jgi:aminoglycoside/choline kinase family phosphotransferase